MSAYLSVSISIHLFLFLSFCFYIYLSVSKSSFLSSNRPGHGHWTWWGFLVFECLYLYLHYCLSVYKYFSLYLSIYISVGNVSSFVVFLNQETGANLMQRLSVQMLCYQLDNTWQYFTRTFKMQVRTTWWFNMYLQDEGTDNMMVNLYLQDEGTGNMMIHLYLLDEGTDNIVYHLYLWYAVTDSMLQWLVTVALYWEFLTKI